MTRYQELERKLRVLEEQARSGPEAMREVWEKKICEIKEQMESMTIQEAEQC